MCSRLEWCGSPLSVRRTAGHQYLSARAACGPTKPVRGFRLPLLLSLSPLSKPPPSLIESTCQSGRRWQCRCEFLTKPGLNLFYRELRRALNKEWKYLSVGVSVSGVAAGLIRLCAHMCACWRSTDFVALVYFGGLGVELFLPACITVRRPESDSSIGLSGNLPSPFFHVWCAK